MRRWPTDRSRRWLSSFLEAAKSDHNVAAVVIVGSAVRTAVHSDDLDLVVICRRRAEFEYKAPIEVDLRPIELSSVEPGIAKGQDLLTWTVRYGEAVYDPEAIWSDVVTRWRDRLPLPDPTVARGRAATALGHLESMRAAGDTEAVIDINVSYLTHLARAALSEAGVYPASRPELPDQLRSIGRTDLADQLEQALTTRADHRAGRTAV